MGLARKEPSLYREVLDVCKNDSSISRPEMTHYLETWGETRGGEGESFVVALGGVGACIGGLLVASSFSLNQSTEYGAMAAISAVGLTVSYFALSPSFGRFIYSRKRSEPLEVVRERMVRERGLDVHALDGQGVFGFVSPKVR